MNSYKNVIENLLEQHRMTVVDLAKRADMPATSIYNILHGTSSQPRKLTLQKIAEVFGKDVNIFYQGASQADSTVGLELVTEIYREIDKVASVEKVNLTEDMKLKIIRQICEDCSQNGTQAVDKKLLRILVLYHKG